MSEFRLFNNLPTIGGSRPGSRRIRKYSYVIAAILAFLVLWEVNFPATAVTFRLTADIDIPEGRKTASSVYEIRYTNGPSFGDASGLSSITFGEAVYFDLGSRGNLFVTMNRSEAGRSNTLNMGEMPSTILHFDVTRCCQWLWPFPSATASVPLEKLPTLISFSDINNPRTARVVKPDKLDEVFGQGVRFNSVRIETTGDAPSFQLEQMIPWLSEYRARDWTLNGEPNRKGGSLSSMLRTSAFVSKGESP